MYNWFENSFHVPFTDSFTPWEVLKSFLYGCFILLSVSVWMYRMQKVTLGEFFDALNGSYIKLRNYRQMRILLNLFTYFCSCFLAFSGKVLEGCQSPQYLQFKKLGIIHCNLNDTFSAVFWYDSTNIFDDEPVVTFTHSIKGGQGYKSGEFDITPDGSLLILDVGLNHEKNFTMARFASLDENPSTFTVCVVVTGM